MIPIKDAVRYAPPFDAFVVGIGWMSERSKERDSRPNEKAFHKNCEIIRVCYALVGSNPTSAKLFYLLPSYEWDLVYDMCRARYDRTVHLIKHLNYHLNPLNPKHLLLCAILAQNQPSALKQGNACITSSSRPDGWLKQFKIWATPVAYFSRVPHLPEDRAPFESRPETVGWLR